MWSIPSFSLCMIFFTVRILGWFLCFSFRFLVRPQLGKTGSQSIIVKVFGFQVWCLQFFTVGGHAGLFEVKRNSGLYQRLLLLVNFHACLVLLCVMPHLVISPNGFCQKQKIWILRQTTSKTTGSLNQLQGNWRGCSFSIRCLGFWAVESTLLPQAK